MSAAGGLLWPILPDAASRAFLRAALAPGAEAAEAFERWCARVGDPGAALRAEPDDRHRALLPLLERSLRAQRPPSLDDRLRTALRTAALHERSRADSFAKVYRDVAQVFERAGIEWLTVGGVALSHGVWPQRGLRHDASIVAVVDAARVADARAALVDAGCAPRGAELRHPAGPPVQVRTHAVAHPRIAGWEGAATLAVGDVAARVPRLEVALLERCESALVGGRREDLSWVCDLWFLAERCDAAAWRWIEARTAESRAAFVAAHVLGALRSLGAAVPEEGVARLVDSARRAPRAEIDAALSCASRSSGVGARAWLAGCGWADRARLLAAGVRWRLGGR